MAVRNDVTVNFQVSPRIATIAAPSTVITIQDLHETLVNIEDSIEGSEYPNLISSAGKEDLGGGAAVGITTTLLNTKLAFEKRLTKLENGTITTPDTTGITLTDSAATFVTNGVVPGDVVRNHTDAGSIASVLSVDSETQITTDGLIGGTDNQFDSADVYDVVDLVACTVSGGNLVAVDDVDAAIDPIFTTFGTFVTLSQSSSATLINGAIDTQIVEGTRTFQEALRIILAACGGKLSGAATTTITIRDADDTKNRIGATVDADGNRSAVTLDDT